MHTTDNVRSGLLFRTESVKPWQPPPKRQRPNRRGVWVLLLALALLAGAIVAQHYRDTQNNSLLLLKQLADSGESGAQLQLGLAYRDGRLGLPRDPQLANEWLRRAERNGNAYAATLDGNPPEPNPVTNFIGKVGVLLVPSVIAKTETANSSTTGE